MRSTQSAVGRARSGELRCHTCTGTARFGSKRMRLWGNRWGVIDAPAAFFWPAHSRSIISAWRAALIVPLVQFTAERRREAAKESARDFRDAGAYEETSAIERHQAGPHERRQVDRSGEGAVAFRSGGEPEEVRYGSRPQNRRPVAPHVWVRHGDAPIAAAPHLGVDERAVVHRGADALERFGDARGGHGSDGRTIIGWIPGRRRKR